jgi:hypothetical protein
MYANMYVNIKHIRVMNMEVWLGFVPQIISMKRQGTGSDELAPPEVRIKVSAK